MCRAQPALKVVGERVRKRQRCEEWGRGSGGGGEEGRKRGKEKEREGGGKRMRLWEGKEVVGTEGRGKEEQGSKGGGKEGGRR